MSLSFPPGSFTAVMGPSGSGKSTLLQCAAGLDRPDSGRISIGGTDLSGLSETALTWLRRDRIGFVFQSFNLIPALTAALGHGWSSAAFAPYVLTSGHAPSSDNQIVVAEPATVGARVTVLTAAGSGLTTFLGIAAVLSGFVAVTVSAAAFGLSVAQRRRDLALLRTIGRDSETGRADDMRRGGARGRGRRRGRLPARSC
ncbi:MAG TPA: ATP-binding cassette domain-containing protein [Trebonia sp.]